MYFDNLIGQGAPSPKFEELAKLSFGSFDAWKSDAKATGLAVPGWVLTCLDTVTGKLTNLQIMEHHIGFTLNQIPVLVLDTWEHAFFLDHKTNRGAYIDVFFKNINWNIVNERLQKALV